jgi:hypothetical protein
MSRQPWQELVVRHCPADKRPCNCGDAWETWLPPETSGAWEVGMSGAGRPVGAWVCQYGCSPNQISTREEIAEKILAAPDAGVSHD